MIEYIYHRDCLLGLMDERLRINTKEGTLDKHQYPRTQMDIQQQIIRVDVAC